MQPVVSRRVLRSALVGVSLLALSACSMFSSSDPRYEPAELTQYEAGVTAAVRWSASVGSGGGYGFAPTVVGEAVFAATPNAVAKVDLASGRVLWRASPDATLTAGAGSDGNTTAVAAGDGTVIAYDANGVEKWRVRATSAVAIPPVVGFGVVVVRSTDYRIQAFDAETGEYRWDVQRPGPALALKTSMQMLATEGLIISGLPSGRLIAINASNGAVQWEAPVSVSRGATDLERINDVVGAPQVIGPLLCGVTYQGRMTCFDINQGGRPVWDVAFSSHSGMSHDGRYAYAANQRDTVHAIDLVSGEEVWTQNALRNRRLATPAVVPAAVAVGDFEGYVHFLSRSDGRLLGRLSVGGGAVLSPLTATPAGVLVQTGNGNLVLVGVN
ncbi:MAG TPA: outer membrane protein assembly factor BamB [Burkholderiaceae bacterium]|jgi:outer membrane protein assembly factor BamB|nr:outer membrane protein assembly factor BamB [Rhodococcus sp. (in: high G+C Gram-positive bacteria)]HLV28059.1 outer membrane protein assembly factor BamB [Burkholderiaceae bacterium]